ncbi:tetratricopeptide repeat protein [Indiicoccus explosivorum]|uniref:tetratricopeptide repeat protein n=1 Tax=Indiicoccus explosivorum TaxID=1917864 RepID=UPI000B43142F|nr:tetratricopeptide repeat protein [Indiicoccus explosivorum]
MYKKHGRLKRKGNVIIFPTAIDRLMEEGVTALQQENFAGARTKMEEVLALEPANPAALGAYAYALYELGEYGKALEATEELLKIGPLHYLETMELHISLLMQLRRYGEAEELIDMLISEGVLPEERIAQFRQLQQLNERIQDQMPSRTEEPPVPFNIEEFLELSHAEQERTVMALEPGAFRQLQDEMVRAVEHPAVDLLAKTYILFMLHRAHAEATVKIEKFHYIGTFHISNLPDPLTSDRLNVIKKQFEAALTQDPTRLEMITELFDRHVYLLFPFQWDEFSPAEVANGYLAYLDAVFTGEAPDSGNPELLQLLLRAEAWFELRNG